MGEDMQLTVKVAMESQTFQQQINNINRQMKVVQTEFQKASSKLGDFGKSTEGIKAKAEALSKQLELQKQKVTMFSEAYKKSEETLQKNVKINEELKNKIEQAKKAYEDSIKATGKNSDETKKLKGELDKLNKEYNNSQNTINNNVRTIDNYKIKLNQAEKEVNQLGKEIKKTNLELTNFKFTQLSEKMASVSEKFKKVGEGFKTVGDGILKKVVAPLAAGGAACGKFYIDFDDSMTKVKTIADTTQVSMGNLSKGVIKLSNDTGKNAEELGNALYETISAGAETKDALGVLEVSTKNAKAGFAETTTSVDVLTTTMNSYKLKAQDLIKISDQLIVAQNFGKTTVAEMGQSMGNVIPIASQMNVGTKELFASIATLTRNGIHTSESIDGMKAALSNIIKPSDEAKKMAEALGLQFNASHLKSVGFAKFLEEVKEKTKGNTGAMAKLFGSVNGLNSMLVLTGKGSSDFTEALKQMNECTGLTDETFKKVTESSGEKFRASLNRMKNSAIQLGSSLTPLMENLSALMDKVAKKLNGMSKEQINGIIQIAKFAAIIGIALSSLGRFIIFAGNVTKAISILTKTQAIMTVGTKLATIAQAALNFAFVTTPIGWVVLGIAAIASGLIYAYKHSERFRNAVNKLGDKLKKFAASIPKFFKNLPSEMVSIGKFIIGGLLNGMLGGIPSVLKSIASIAGGIKNIFKKAMGIHSPSQVMKEYGQYIDEGLVEGMDDGEDDVLEKTKAIADGIKQSLDKNLEKINKFGEAITTALKNKYDKLQDIQEKSLEKQLENEQKAHDKKLKLIDEEYNEKLKLVDEEAYKKVKALENEINGIDKETEQEEKALKNKEYNEKLSEMNKRLYSAKSSKEKAEIQKDIDKTIADHNRELVTEQRKEKKEQLKSEIDLIKENLEKKKEQLKKELEAKKDNEKDKLKVVEDNLKDEKDKVKTHFEELKKEENLQLEARKLILSKNTTEIMALLKEYNPQWQNVGQSFAESLTTGLNSEKQSMQDSINDMLNIKPTVDEQILALQNLEVEIENLKEAKKKSKGKGKNSKDEDIDDIVSEIGAMGDAADETGLKLDELGLKEEDLMEANNLLEQNTKENCDKSESSYDNSLGKIEEKIINFKNAVVKKFQEGYGEYKTIAEGLALLASNKMKDIKQNAENTASNINKSMQDAKQSIIDKWEDIKNSIPAKVEEMKGNIKSKFDDIHEKIATIGENIKEKLKDMFTFDIPHIKMPHFSMRGEFNLVPPSVPKFDVNWYDKGGIFDRPSVIGVAEKRPEFVGALDDLRYLIREELDKKMLKHTGEKTILEIPIYLNSREIVRATVEDMDEALAQYNKDKKYGRKG